MAIVRNVVRPVVRSAVHSVLDKYGGFDWASYWSTHLDDEANLAFRSTGRNGLTLPASIGDSPTLLMPYYKMLTGSGSARVADNGALDVGANTGFTLCGWANCFGITATGYKVISGKYIRVGTVPDGFYGIRILPTSNYLSSTIKPTGGAKTISGTTDMSGIEWFFYLIDINQTTLKLRLFVYIPGGSLTQIGSDTAFTGTFPALDNMYKFGIGAGNHGDTGNAYDTAIFSHSDCWVIKKILTPTEMNDLITNHYSATIAKSDVLAYWPCNTASEVENELLYDVSGNNRYLTVTDVDTLQATVGYSAYGSPWNLLKGHTICKNLANTKDKYISVPYDYDGNPLSSPTMYGGFTIKENISGNASYYNFTNSLVRFAVGGLWDRSNATIWSDKARNATNGYYDVANPSDWHSTELKQDLIDDWLNDDYKDINFLKAISDSNNVRTYLHEIRRTFFDTVRVGAYKYGYDSSIYVFFHN